MNTPDATSGWRSWFSTAVLFAAIAFAPPRALAADEAPEAEDPPPPPPTGFDMGYFEVRDTRVVDNEEFKLQFQLFAIVEEPDDEESEDKTAEEFDQRFTRWEHRVRDQVLTAVRLTPVEFYEEPDLSSFRRRILLRLRRAMPELAIETILVTEFRMLSD